ncbi:hypothetical protein VP1G_11273 [Cytospora mali]|uniref:Uncharacterized protein n=1 Tax=Cytospora mali TaxID=578113 RepID=A0A194VAG7_CYTMA|nr:hypothetical protein VP1G_11273 [Valsa mali var. pyri (nom. inval.)]
MLAIRHAKTHGLLRAPLLRHKVPHAEPRPPGRPVQDLRVPPAGAEAHDAAEVRPVVVQVLGQGLGAELHQHLHVHLRLVRAARHERGQLRVAELRAHADLGRGGEDLGLEGQRYRLADALLADGVGPADHEEAVAVLAGFLAQGGEGGGGCVAFGAVLGVY